VTVDTPRTQALIGFVGAQRKALTHLSAEITNRFASLVLSSMDQRPIAGSEKMLLTAGSRVANSGMKWNEMRTRLTAQGSAPTLIEPVSGTITLRNLANVKALAAATLDGSGRALGDPIKGIKTPDGWKLAIGDPVTTWYVIVVRH